MRAPERLQHQYRLPQRPAAGRCASSQALQASLSSVGIKTTLKGYTAANYYGTFAGVPTYVHSHDLGLLAGGWGPDWPNAYGWGWALYDGKAIVPAGNANMSELNDPNINKWFLAMEQTTSKSQSNAYANMINHAGHEGRRHTACRLRQGAAVPAPRPDERLYPALLRHV